MNLSRECYYLLKELKYHSSKSSSVSSIIILFSSNNIVYNDNLQWFLTKSHSDRHSNDLRHYLTRAKKSKLTNIYYQFPPESVLVSNCPLSNWYCYHCAILINLLKLFTFQNNNETKKNVCSFCNFKYILIIFINDEVNNIISIRY